MSTYTQILYQIVYATWKHEKTLDSSTKDELYRYISGLIENKKCHLYCIGGVSDHIHIITHIHPSVSLASLVKDLKLASTDFVKKNRIFQSFSGWQDGYGAFTYSYHDKNRLIEYVKNQETHHHVKTFKEELKDLLKEHDIPFDEKFLL